ncbi:MAG: translocation/assembly module TamB domain-containing protein [Desulfosoma sp.]
MRKKKNDAAGSGIFPGIVKGVAALGAVGIAVPLLLVLLIHTPWAQKRLMQAAAARIEEETGIRVGMSGFRWHPFRSLRVDDPSAEAGGRPLFSAASLRLDYTLTWSRPYVDIREVVLTEPVLRLQKGADGSWRLPIPAENGRHKDADGAPLWGKLPPVSFTVVSGRIQGFEGERCVMDVAEMNGRVSLRGRLDDGRSSVEISLDPWRMEIQVPVRDTVRLSAQAFYGDGTLRLENVTATVNETSHLTASGTWYDLPKGALSIQLRAEPWRFSMKGGGDEGSPIEAETLQGTIQVEGTLKELRCRYDLQSSRGHLSGTGAWAKAEDALRLSADISLHSVLLPWGVKGPTTVSGTARLTAEWQKNAEPKLSLSAAMKECTSGSLALRDVTVEATYDDGVCAVRKASARVGDSGIVETSGTAVLKKKKGSGETAGLTLDLTVEADRLPLTVFQDFWPQRPMAGVLSGRGTVQGSWPYLTWTGRLAGTDVALSPFRAKKIAVDGVSSLAGLRGSRKVAVEVLSFAYGDRFGEALSVTFRQDPAGDSVSFEAEGRRFFGLDRMIVKGTVTSLFDFPKILRVDKADVGAAGETFQVQGEIRYRQDAVELRSLRVSHGNEQAVVQGTIGKPAPMDLSVQLSAVDVGRWLSKFSSGGILKPQPIPEALGKTGQGQGEPQTTLAGVQGFFSKGRFGRLDGRLRLQGSWDSPIAAFDGAASEMELSNLGRAVLTFSGRYEKGTLTGRGELSGPMLESPVILEGTWPARLQFLPFTMALAETGEGRLRTTGRDVPLERFQAVIPLENLKGRASWDVRLLGPLAALRLEGSGAVTRAAFRWPHWGEPFEDMDIRWRAEGSSILIEDATFRLLGSRARAWGEIRLPHGRFDGYTVYVAGEGVHFPEIFGIEGEGAARGTISQAGWAFAPDIAGDVILTKASINLGELEKDVARQIRVVEETGRGSVVLLGARGSQRKKPEGFQNVAMKLNIQLPPKGAWVRGFGLEAEVQGAATLEKARGGPIQLLGTLSTSKGEYAFQGVRLKVVEGEITFRGHSPPDPFLSLTCQKEVRDVSVTAALSGPLSRPALVFSSSPEMDQVDIVSVLLYGRPARELSMSQSRDLQDRGVQFVWAGTTPVVKSLLGKTPFSPDAVDIKGTENGSVVEIGKYLTPELYVTYQKGLEGEDKDELRAEYRVNRYLSVESQVGREDRAGVDVFFRYDFGD